MDPTMGAALAGAASSIQGGLMQFVGNTFLQDRQNEANKKLWEEQVAYNTPEAQMTRLKSAGLNPALVYGHGAPMNVAGAPPQMGRAEAPNVATDVASTQQVVNASIVHDKMVSDARAAEAAARIAESNAKTQKDVLDATGFNIGWNASTPEGRVAMAATAARNVVRSIAPPDRTQSLNEPSPYGTKHYADDYVKSAGEDYQ